MDTFQDYRIIIRLRSPIGTPWQSDIIWGHLAWLVVQRRGPEKLGKFLQAYKDRTPPFVLSDGFPLGLLPRPYLPVHPAADEEHFKQRKKSRYVREEDFARLRRGETDKWQPVSSPWRQVEILHASLDRRTNTTTGGAEAGEAGGGNLFSTSVQFLAPEYQDKLAIYVRAKSEDWAKWVCQMLTELSRLGFGRDRSTGVGAFEVLTREPYAGFEPLEEANGFISLSSYCPAAGDPRRGRWQLRLKYGKLGENAGQGNPFKRPLIQFEPGAIFYTEGPPAPFYGRVVPRIAPGLPEAIQCGFTLAVPCILPNE